MEYKHGFQEGNKVQVREGAGATVYTIRNMAGFMVELDYMGEDGTIRDAGIVDVSMLKPFKE